MQPEKSGTHVLFAPHPKLDWPTILRDASYGLVITEGGTRSLAGVVRELPVISIMGVDCGQVNGKLHPDLAAIEWRGRPLFLAFRL